MSTYRIIFDNSGGIILQLGDDYAHYYQDAKRAAEDLKDYLADQDTSDWDGHNDDAMDCDPTDDEVANGGCQVFCAVEDLPEWSSWHNINYFRAAFTA